MGVCLPTGKLVLVVRVSLTLHSSFLKNICSGERVQFYCNTYAYIIYLNSPPGRDAAS